MGTAAVPRPTSWSGSASARPAGTGQPATSSWRTTATTRLTMIEVSSQGRIQERGWGQFSLNTPKTFAPLFILSPAVYSLYSVQCTGNECVLCTHSFPFLSLFEVNRGGHNTSSSANG